MRALEQRSDCNRELAAAFGGVALIKAGTRFNRGGIVYRTTVSANWTIGPKVAFEPLTSFSFVVESFVLQLICHDRILSS